MDAPDLVLIGERAALGPLRRDLAALYARWVNDVDTGRTLGYAGVATPASEEAYVDAAVMDMGGAHPRAAHFTIYDLADREPVGTCALMGIEWPAGTARLGIVIGEPERRGRGLGTEATRLTLVWGFTRIGLHNVLLQVLATNTAAIRAYERAGFRPVGTRRGAAWAGGRRVDELLMDAVPALLEPQLA
jgi:diamine N-acetyltransferase